MIPRSIDISVTNGVDPITRRPCFVIDGEFPNPPLRLYYGYTYRFIVNTHNILRFMIKEELGAGDIGGYNSKYIDNNVGVTKGIITYTPVREEGLPLTIGYQAVDDELCYGCIHLLPAPPKFPNGNWVIDYNNPITMREFIEKINYNFENCLTIDNISLGFGLKLENGQIRLDTPDDALFLRRGNRLLLASEKFSLNDTANELLVNPDITVKHTLQEWLDILATMIRNIKDHDSSFLTPLGYSMDELEERLERAEISIEEICRRVEGDE